MFRSLSLTALLLLSVQCGKPMGTTQPSQETLKTHSEIKFLLDQTASITFSGPSAFPVTASCEAIDGSVITKCEVASSAVVQLRALVRPGTYNWVLRPSNIGHSSIYIPYILPSVHIDKSGGHHFWMGRLENVVFLAKVLGMQPSDDVVIKDDRPRLTWDAVLNARYFVVQLEHDNDLETVKTLVPEFRVTSDLQQNCQYSWDVSAYDINERRLAFGNATFLSRGSTPISIRRTIPKLPTGDGYLGLVLADWIDASTTKGGLILGPGTSPRPAMLIEGVVPDSPGIDAGLLPGDVITAINGCRIESDRNGTGQAESFAQYVSELRPGNRVSLTIRRDGGSERDVKLIVVSRPPRITEAKMKSGGT